MILVQERNGITQQWDNLAFKIQVTAQYLRNILADFELPHILHAGQAFQEQDAPDERIGVFHLIDGFVLSAPCSVAAERIASQVTPLQRQTYMG